MPDPSSLPALNRAERHNEPLSVGEGVRAKSGSLSDRLRHTVAIRSVRLTSTPGVRHTKTKGKRWRAGKHRRDVCFDD
jgi:hypothetical protein